MSYKEETTSMRDITGNLQVYETPEFSIVIPYQEEARTVKTKPASKKRTLELLADYFSYSIREMKAARKAAKLKHLA